MKGGEWWQVRVLDLPAAVSLTDDLEAPDQLLTRLDRAIQAHEPNPGMYF